MKGYYFITDTRLSRAGNANDVAQAVAAGVRVVQYREKEADTPAMIEEARILRRLCRGALFLINDRVEVALAVEADGVHLGQEDLHYSEARRLLGPGKIIGITVNTVAQAIEAAQLGADYLGVSPIFATRTKPDAGEPAGLALLREIRARVRLPLVAIGGITLDNAPAVIQAGADGLCAISAVVTKPDVRGAIAYFQRLFKDGYDAEG
ncbi:MAG: thiamine phosphate synthase [Deltaproteobacteria bacterium]|nr:thiamine phosphate synthase [Deltaproteobacteria bacterium]